MKKSIPCGRHAATRQSFLQRAAALSALAAMSPLAMMRGAEAAALEIKHQAPGFYRIALGKFEVTALCDGTIDFPMDRILSNAKPAEVAALFRDAYLSPPIRTSVNQFLIDTGSKLVLVDAGAGTLLGPALGQLLANLRASGYEPQDVDDVLITHLHIDHIGGLSRSGKMLFPNATVHVNKRDLDYWLRDVNAGNMSDTVRENAEADKASLAPYIAAGRVKTFDGEVVLMPGVSTVPAYGHTPGHCCFRIESDGSALLLTGDVVHAAAVQFADPAVSVIWDSDPNEAEAQRRKLFAAAAKHGLLTGGAHIAFPGLGHVRTENRGYAWVPLNYDASV